MKRLNNGMAIVIVTIALFGMNLQAAVPQTINYQGRLTDGGGAPVTDGAKLVKFTIYDAAIGGSTMWNSGFQNVTTTNGLFTYDLGSNVALPDNLFADTSRYLGITVGVDPEISPRTRLETSAYASHALLADSALFAPSTVGITQRFFPGTPILTGFFNALGNDTIICPSDGFVMMTISLAMNCNHTSGDEDVIFVFLIDDSSGVTILQDQDSRAWSIPASMPTGSYSTLISLHRVFPVGPGFKKFNAFAFQNAGGGTDNFGESDVTVSLLFIPKSFGAVEVGSPTPPSSQFNSLPNKIR